MNLKKLRAEVKAGYLKRINHEMTDEEAAEYSEKDRLLVALERAMRWTKAAARQRSEAERETRRAPKRLPQSIE